MAYQLLGMFARSYLAGGVAGWGNAARAGSRNGIQLGDYNAVRDLGLSGSKAVVELPDLLKMKEILGEVGPDAFKQFKNNARKLGKPAQTELRRTYGRIGINGPLGGPKRPGRRYDRMATNYSHARLSFMRSRVILNTAKAVDVNYKDRKASRNLQKLRAGGDGTISIVRLLVKAPALIISDMAGKSGRARMSVGDRTREYQQDLFGKGVVTRDHVITFQRRRAITIWLDALDRKAHNAKQKEASRYAWPTMEAYMPRHKEEASKLFNDTIKQINDALGN